MIGYSFIYPGGVVRRGGDLGGEGQIQYLVLFVVVFLKERGAVVSFCMCLTVYLLDVDVYVFPARPYRHKKKSAFMTICSF